MQNILLNVTNTINTYSLLRQKDKVLIAVSGGPDSMFLLHILDSYLKKPFNLELHIAHLNHSLRGTESDRDEEFVREKASALGIDATFGKINGYEEKQRLRTSLESACHYARIGFLRETAEKTGASKIATGHNLDDRIETFFINLLRGTSVSGLTGISPYNKTLGIIRPLIDIRSEDIRQLLKNEGISFRTDSSNLSDSFLRNRIRKDVIPSLIKLNPSFHKSIKRTMELAANEDIYIKKQFHAFFRKNIKKISPAEFGFDKKIFMSADKAIAARTLIHILSDFKEPRTRISRTHVDNAIDFISSSEPGAQLHLPSGIRILNIYSRIAILKQPKVQEEPEKTRKFTPPGQILLPEFRTAIEAVIMDRHNIDTVKTDCHTALLDFEKINIPLIIRHRRKGDFFHPLGFRGRKKLQDFFVDIKLPRHKRDEVPVILSDNEIIWVCGHRISDIFKVDENTKTVLVLKAKPADEA